VVPLDIVVAAGGVDARGADVLETVSNSVSRVGNGSQQLLRERVCAEQKFCPRGGGEKRLQANLVHPSKIKARFSENGQVKKMTKSKIKK
jgi:hypothetical protein